MKLLLSDNLRRRKKSYARSMKANAHGFWFAVTGDAHSEASAVRSTTFAPCRESAGALNSGVNDEGAQDITNH